MHGGQGYLGNLYLLNFFVNLKLVEIVFIKKRKQLCSEVSYVINILDVFSFLVQLFEYLELMVVFF